MISFYFTVQGLSPPWTSLQVLRSQIFHLLSQSSAQIEVSALGYNQLEEIKRFGGRQFFLECGAFRNTRLQFSEVIRQTGSCNFPQAETIIAWPSKGVYQLGRDKATGNWKKHLERSMEHCETLINRLGLFAYLAMNINSRYHDRTIFVHSCSCLLKLTGLSISRFDILASGIGLT